MFFRFLWIVLAILLLIGIGAGFIMSSITMTPGLSGDAASTARAYVTTTQWHGIAMGLSLPTAMIGGLTTFLLAEQQHGQIAAFITNACGMVLIGLALSALLFAEQLQAFVGDAGNLIVVFACAALLSYLLARHPARNATAFIFLGGCLPPIFFHLIVHRVSGGQLNGDVLSDTHAETAGIHITGLATTLLMLSCLSVWSKSRGARLNGWITAAYALALIMVARSFIAAHFSVGLSGMPRRYADYPEQFAPNMQLASWLGFAYGALIILGVVRLFVAVWSRDRSTAADAF